MAKTFTSGEVLTASDVNVNLATYMPMIPTSVSGTGVAYNTTTGLVTLTAASTASLNGVFTSTYSRYEIQWDFPTTTANVAWTLRLRAAGVDDSTAVYDTQSTVARGSDANVVITESIAATSWTGGPTTASRLHVGSTWVYRPAAATPTLFDSKIYSTLNPATAAATTGIYMRAGLFRNSTAFDGISFIFSGGDVTGTIKVMAYN